MTERVEQRPDIPQPDKQESKRYKKVNPAKARLLLFATAGQRERADPDNTAPITPIERTGIEQQTTLGTTILEASEKLSIESRKVADTDWDDFASGLHVYAKAALEAGDKDLAKEDRIAALTAVGLLDVGEKDILIDVKGFYDRYFYDGRSDVGRFIEDLSKICRDEQGFIKQDDLIDMIESLAFDPDEYGEEADLLLIFGKKDNPNLLVADLFETYGLINQPPAFKQETIIPAVEREIQQQVPEDDGARDYLLALAELYLDQPLQPQADDNTPPPPPPPPPPTVEVPIERDQEVSVHEPRKETEKETTTYSYQAASSKGGRSYNEDAYFTPDGFFLPAYSASKSKKHPQFKETSLENPLDSDQQHEQAKYLTSLLNGLEIVDQFGRPKTLDYTPEDISRISETLKINIERGYIQGLTILADGMGGHADGDIASSIATIIAAEQLQYAPTPPPPGTRQDEDYRLTWLKNAVVMADRVLEALNKKMGKNMGTTMTITATVADETFGVSVADSRIYKRNKDTGDVNLLTRDGSGVWRWLKNGTIKTPSEFLSHPRRNEIIPLLRGRLTPNEISTFHTTLARHEQLISCSDGVWEGVNRNSAVLQTIDREYLNNIAGGMDREAAAMLAFGRIFRDMNLAGLPNEESLAVYLTRSEVGELSGDNATVTVTGIEQAAEQDTSNKLDVQPAPVQPRQDEQPPVSPTENDPDREQEQRIAQLFPYIEELVLAKGGKGGIEFQQGEEPNETPERDANDDMLRLRDLFQSTKDNILLCTFIEEEDGKIFIKGGYTQKDHTPCTFSLLFEDKAHGEEFLHWIARDAKGTLKQTFDHFLTLYDRQFFNNDADPFSTIALGEIQEIDENGDIKGEPILSYY